MMIPSSYRVWVPVSLGLHLVLMMVLGRTALPGPPPDSGVTLIPISVAEAAVPSPAITEPQPPPQPDPKPRPTPQTTVRQGQPTGKRDNPAVGPGGGIRLGTGKTNPAPPDIMRVPDGKGKPAPPGIDGGSGTQGTGKEPAGPTSGPVSLGGPTPGYPKLAEDAGEEGTVVLTVTIGANGEVEDVAVSSSSGHSRLDDAAVRAVRLHKFASALLKGKPVSGTYKIRYTFANGDVTGG